MTAPRAAAAPSRLLSTLQAITKALGTRRAVQAELDQALSSFLSSSPAPLAPGPDLLAAPPPSPSGSPARPDLAPSTSPTARTATSCAAEAATVRAPSEEELQEVLRIGFLGLVEIKEEIKALLAVVVGECRREDLGRVVRGIEELESERMRETLQRDQLRRLQMLQPELEFGSSIADKNRLRDDLARRIQEETQELQAEIADLSVAEASEQDGAVQAEP
ncbi:hypothetical protein JCM21900_003854 [Sporobolomyces salmonicolor]